MTKASALRLSLPLLIVCCASLFCIAEIARAQTTCPTGSQAATAADLATMTTDGITNPQVGQCWNPSNFGGAAAAQAKQYLQSDVCPGSKIDTDDLNPGFAVCAQKFVQSAKAQNSNFCITSAYRSPTQQLAACMSICGQSSCPGLCAEPGSSFHQYGLAIDVKTSIPLPTLWNLEQAQGIINPTGLHSSDPYHVQAPSMSTPICNSGNLNPNNISISPAQGIANALGLNNSGQVATQASYCVVSNNPIYVVQVPAGTAFPSNCVSTGAGTGPSTSMCTPQSYCSGNMIMSQSSSCTLTTLQTCQYGCSNGACTQQQSTTPTATPTATPASGSAAATTPASSGTTATTPSTGTVTSTGSSATSILSPTLAANNGTSTLALLDELAGWSSSGTTTATDTPIILNAADSEIAQLEANAPPGVSYAEPTSAYFPGSQSAGGASSNQTSVTNENNNTNVNNNVSVTQGQGYQIGATGNSYTVTSGTGYGGSGANSGTEPQAGVETFPQTAPADISGPTPAYGNPTTLGLIGLLDNLRAQVQGAIAFLSIYTQPFQGNVPSQNVGE